MKKRLKLEIFQLLDRFTTFELQALKNVLERQVRKRK